MVMINPSPNQPDTPNGAPVAGTPNFSGQIAQSAAGVAGGLLSGLFGIKQNTINVFLNTTFYAIVGAVGLWLTYRGLTLIVQEIPGAPGAGSIIGDVPGKLARGTANVGKFVTTDGLSSVGTAAKTVGRKVKGGTLDFVHGKKGTTAREGRHSTSVEKVGSHRA